MPDKYWHLKQKYYLRNNVAYYISVIALLLLAIVSLLLGYNEYSIISLLLACVLVGLLIHTELRCISYQMYVSKKVNIAAPNTK